MLTSGSLTFKFTLLLWPCRFLLVFFCDNYIYHLVLQRNCLFIINYTWFCWNFETLSLFTLTAHTIKTHEVLPEFVEPPYHYKLQYYLVIFLLLECWLYVNVYVFLNPVRTSRGSTNQLTMTTHNNAANFMMLIAHHLRVWDCRKWSNHLTAWTCCSRVNLLMNYDISRLELKNDSDTNTMPPVGATL